jgi:putative serine/threonine protein kinase
MLLQKFLELHDLRIVEKISKGYSSEIFLVENAAGERFALKVEKQKSTRVEMARKEAEFLKLANSIGVGPKLIAFDLEAKCILMEFVNGERFSDWLFRKRTKKELETFFSELFGQAKKLDKIGLDHGQLGGCARNILVCNGKPVIIDFEKASRNRRVHNLSQLLGEFFYSKHSRYRKRIIEIFGNEEKLAVFLEKIVGKIQGFKP